VAVIGAGQAGLSAAYHLRRQGLEYVVLDGNRAGRAAATAVSKLLRAA
jgi:cation diffusion facilitator CzcD-associated flavoprotein CzcO